MNHSNIPVFLPHLGCPFKCLFCEQNQISHQGSIPLPDDLPKIIESHLKTVDTSRTRVELAFFGGSFTALDLTQQEGYLNSAQPYLSRGLLTGIRISTRPDCIDTAILEFLGKRGVKTIELGVQSFDDEVLDLSGRGYSRSQAIQACRLTKEKGFILGIQLMIGLPGDTPGRDRESTCMSIGLEPGLVRIYPTLVVRGTGLEKQMLDGTYKPMNMTEALAVTKEMYLAFQACGIPVVRMGLHAGEELRAPGVVLGGPYHPAFGELVKQEVFKEQAMLLMKSLLEDNPSARGLVVLVNRRDASKMAGWKRNNILELKEACQLDELRVSYRDSLERDWLGVELTDGSGASFLTRAEFIKERGGSWASF